MGGFEIEVGVEGGLGLELVVADAVRAVDAAWRAAAAIAGVANAADNVANPDHL